MRVLLAGRKVEAIWAGVCGGATRRASLTAQALMEKTLVGEGGGPGLSGKLFAAGGGDRFGCD